MNPTPAPMTAAREAEIHFNLADALDNFLNEPVVGSKQYIEDVRDLLTELDRRTAATADLLAGLVKLLAPPCEDEAFPAIAVARIHAAAAEMGLTL